MSRLSHSPLLAQLRQASRQDWLDDVLAGAITAVLLIPQAMAYALLAGLPAQMGLYAAMIPPVVYAFLGSSRVLAVGPVAVAALMVASALSEFAEGDMQAYMEGALVLAVETGVLLLLLGFLGLGRMVSFISHPVLTGFTSGAAILIVLSQLPQLLGLADLPAVAEWGDALSPPTLVLSVAAILALLLANRPLQRLLQALGFSARAALLASRCAPLLILLAAVLVLRFVLPQWAASVAMVGEIPGSLPRLAWPALASEAWRQLFPAAAMIAVVGYVESISVARALAARQRQGINANQELIALGAASTASGLFGGMPVAGGFSRSVVNFEAGARTQLASVISALLVGLVALFFSAWFAFLPKAILASIIVVAVIKLLDLPAAWQVWTYDKGDGLALLATALGVLVYGLELGLLLGIALSLALYLWRTGHPHMAVIGRVPGTEHYRNVRRHSVETQARTVMIRIDENLYFANVEAVESYISEQLAAADHPRYLLLVLSAVSYIDSSALEMLEGLQRNLAAAGVEMHLAEVKGPVMDRLANTGLSRALGDARVHLTCYAAEQALLELSGHSPQI